MVIRTSNTTLYVELLPNNDLLTKDFHLDGYNYYNHSADPCLFQGRILSHNGGMAAISTCEGDGKIHGMLLMPEDKYTIQPISSMEPHLDSPPIEKDTVPHILSKYSENVEEFCATDHFAPRGIREDNEIPDVRIRKKRSKNVPTIEMAVFVDKVLMNHYEEKKINARNAIFSILNQVQLIYKYRSLDINIVIKIVKLELSSNAKDDPDNAGGDIDKYLDNFCVLQSEKKRESKIRWNLAIQLTGINLYKKLGNVENKKVLGLAWVNGMCRNRYSCTISEGTSFEAAFVIAHEMGHSLSMLHDGSNNSCDPDTYIMSPKTGAGKTNWSPCSNKYLKEFLKMPYSHCLTDNDDSSYDLSLKMDPRLPGQKYPPKIQCEFALGSGYRVYRNPRSPYNNICRELWCVDGMWATPAHPALEGSTCGDKKMCIEGDCIAEKRSLSKRPTSTERSIQKDAPSTPKPTVLDRLRQFWNNVTNIYRNFFSGG